MPVQCPLTSPRGMDGAQKSTLNWRRSLGRLPHKGSDAATRMSELTLKGTGCTNKAKPILIRPTNLKKPQKKQKGTSQKDGRKARRMCSH